MTNYFKFFGIQLIKAVTYFTILNAWPTRNVKIHEEIILNDLFSMKFQQIFIILIAILLLTGTAVNRHLVAHSDTRRAHDTFSIHRKDTVESGSDTLTWHRPRFPEREEERHRLVEEGIRQRGITDTKVLDAMRRVPRHLFVPGDQRAHAYLNRPLPIGHQQTISQPYIVAYMTRALDLKAGDKVLEIGTGSGYQAAVLSEITPHVYTIEIVEPLGKQAIERFKKLGYSTITTKIGDGYKGWSEHAPFDAIILTAAAGRIPPPLLDQLKPGATMVMPSGDVNEPQILIKITKTEEGEINKERLLPVRFVPMTGEVQDG